MNSDGRDSVTHWIKGLGTSRHEAASKLLWDRYFASVARLAEGRLGRITRGPADGEDVALSVFDTLFRGAAAGRFQRLDSREDLWRLLLTIAARKSCNIKRDEYRQKRGAGMVARSVAAPDGQDILTQAVGREPTPEFAAYVADEFQRLSDRLADESLRLVVRMKLEGYSNGEIATALDCGLRTVERKLEVIRKRWLAEELP